MTFKTLLLLTMLISISAMGQAPRIKNNQTPVVFPSTGWDFICEKYALTGLVHVQITKTENSGIMKLSIATTNVTFTISGTVYVFLKDNTIITCLDKAQHYVAGNSIASNYYLSLAEMTKLKRTAIESIHFNIKGTTQGFNSQVGNFTALNKKHYFATAFDQTKKSYDTAADITALYN